MTKGYLSPSSTAKTYRDAARHRAAEATLSLKSDLIVQYQKLERAGCKRDANVLARIIGELEAWQVRVL